MRVICPQCGSTFGDDDTGKVYKCRECGEFFQVGENMLTGEHTSTDELSQRSESLSHDVMTSDNMSGNPGSRCMMECERCGKANGRDRTLVMAKIFDEKVQGYDHGTSTGTVWTTTYRLSHTESVNICESCIRNERNHRYRRAAVWSIPVLLLLLASIALFGYSNESTFLVFVGFLMMIVGVCGLGFIVIFLRSYSYDNTVTMLADESLRQRNPNIESSAKAGGYVVFSPSEWKRLAKKSSPD